MMDINISRGTWVVVCDGAKALMLENDGDSAQLDLRTREALSQSHEPDRELGAGKPGRSHQAYGLGGSAVEETSWQRQAEEAFLKSVAAKLDVLVGEGQAKKIVLAAPPRALGVIRPHLGADVEAAIVAEIAKDLTNFPVEQIERYFAA